MDRLVFLKNYIHTNGDRYRAGLYYQVADEELRGNLIEQRIAYPENEDPPFDEDTIEKMLVDETQESHAAMERWRRRKAREAFRDERRIAAEAHQAAVKAARQEIVARARGGDE